jgi:putative nucleotidyltransferase with HDIG domain
MNPYNNRDIYLWFGQYTKKYMLLNKEEQYPIALKIIHCQRVRREAVLLGKVLNLSDSDLSVLEATGLLHDIGRFKQYSRYKTFADSVSVNHAEYGAHILSENSALKKFSEKEEARIIKAISYHNSLNLPLNEDDDVLFLTRIIRDADKLDIWRVFINYKNLRKEQQNSTVDLDLPGTPKYSEKALADIISKQNVDYRHVINKNDFALMRLGWIYDVNFTYTFKEILKRDYLTSLKLSLPQDDKIEKVFEEAQAYVENRATEDF